MQANCPSPTDRRFRSPCRKAYETEISGGRGGACSSLPVLFYIKKAKNCIKMMQFFLIFPLNPQPHRRGLLFFHANITVPAR